MTTEPTLTSEASSRTVDPQIAERVQLEIERTIRRQIKGLEFISTGDPAVGLTPKDVIHSRGTMRLYHYRSMAEEVYRVPVLFVMSLVSKAYIVDLVPNQSLVQFMLEQGFDVYLIDWGIPRPEDSQLRLEDYIDDFIPDCVAQVLEDSGEDELSIVGYCMGGMMAACYAALNPDGPLRNLACFTTPVDANGMTLFKTWTDQRYFDVDRVVDTLGNVPPELLFASFELLKPANRMTKRVQLWDNMWNDEFVRTFRLFDRWGADQIPFPGECFRQLVKQVMWENRFLRNELEIAGKRVDLGNLRVPLVHVVAEHDHIVPYEAARHLVPLAGSDDKQEIVLKGGHVSLVAGGNAVYRLWPQIDRWLAPRSV